MVHDVMAIKPNFLASMGYQYFVSYGAPCAFLAITKTGDKVVVISKRMPVIIQGTRVSASVRGLRSLVFHCLFLQRCLCML